MPTPPKERLHIILGEQSQLRLERLMESHDSNRTDTVVRALKIYELFDEMMAEGGIWTKDADDHMYRVRII